MSTEVETFVQTIREKYEAAKEQAELYGLMLSELENAVGKPAATSRPRKSARRKPVKADVSASDAVLRLLAGSKIGLPSAEIVEHVAATYGHKPNSLRTTLYNLKKIGAIVQDEQRIYHHAESVG